MNDSSQVEATQVARESESRDAPRERCADIGDGPIHYWFELSYAQYLTIPRTALQSMPHEWQRRFTECLDQLDEAIDWRPIEGQYWVALKDERGRYVHDPLMDYERGRRRLPIRVEPTALESAPQGEHGDSLPVSQGEAKREDL